jgi:spore coat protein CotH
VLANVGVRLKGRGSFRAIDQKPSFAIKFDEYIEGQAYRGFKKLLFNNSVQDASYVSELLATELFRDAGVPAARVTHARMRLNGRDLGLYVVVEAMNKDFLKRNFGSGDGQSLRDLSSGYQWTGGAGQRRRRIPSGFARAPGKRAGSLIPRRDGGN